LRQLEGAEIERKFFTEVAKGLETYADDSEREALAG
jgi:hypothetical protein